MWKARLGDHHTGGAPPRLAYAAEMSNELYRREGSWHQTPVYQEVERMRGVCAKVALENSAIAALLPKLRDQGMMLRTELHEQVEKLAARVDTVNTMQSAVSAEVRQVCEMHAGESAKRMGTVEQDVIEQRQVFGALITKVKAEVVDCQDSLSSRLERSEGQLEAVEEMLQKARGSIVAMERRLLGSDSRMERALRASREELQQFTAAHNEEVRAEAAAAREVFEAAAVWEAAAAEREKSLRSEMVQLVDSKVNTLQASLVRLDKRYREQLQKAAVSVRCRNHDRMTMHPAHMALDNSCTRRHLACTPSALHARAVTPRASQDERAELQAQLAAEQDERGSWEERCSRLEARMEEQQAMINGVLGLGSNNLGKNELLGRYPYGPAQVGARGGGGEAEATHSSHHHDQGMQPGMQPPHHRCYDGGAHSPQQYQHQPADPIKMAMPTAPTRRPLPGTSTYTSTAQAPSTPSISHAMPAHSTPRSLLPHAPRGCSPSLLPAPQSTPSLLTPHNHSDNWLLPPRSDGEWSPR